MFFEKDPFLKKWERNLAEKPKRIFSEKQKTLPSCSFGLLAFFVCLGGQFMLLPHRKAETTQLFSQREIVSVGVGGEPAFFKVQFSPFVQQFLPHRHRDSPVGKRQL